MGKIGRLGRDPALEKEQMVEVYEAAGRSIDPAVLQEVADRMFPNSEAKFYCSNGSFRGFVDENGTMHKAKYTIGTGPNWVGIMEDGTAIPY